MKKCISILGSTGSIGVQALDVVRNLNMISNPDIRVLGLTADKNIDLLETSQENLDRRLFHN